MKPMQLEFPLGPKPAPFARGSVTSQAAAASVNGCLTHLQGKVLYAIQHAPFGMTCDEVELYTDLSHQTASARVNELARQGKIQGVGTRPTRSGRKATVWVVVE